LDSKRRKIRMAQFRNGNLQCVVAPRVLDEGVDVPEADVAVVLAAFRSRRQMVQRLGRVLRVKEDGREAALLVVHATGTREDPAKGAHEDFLGEVRDVAREVVSMDADSGPGAVIGFVVGGDTGGRRLSVPQR
ncbi:MAG: superfamily II DNA or RNA helicase, partial [Myxococcota bacterium]